MDTASTMVLCPECGLSVRRVVRRRIHDLRRTAGAVQIRGQVLALRLRGTGGSGPAEAGAGGRDDRSAPAGIHACPGVGSTAGNAGDRRDISDDGSRGHVLLVQLADLQVLCEEEIGWHRSGAKAPAYKQHPARLSAGRDAVYMAGAPERRINWPFPAEKSHGPARRR